MLTQRVREILVGLLVISATLVLVLLALKASSLHQSNSSNRFIIHAYFDDVGSLMVKAPVRIAGVKVGEVVHVGLDSTTLKAKVDLSIDKVQKTLPTDSSVSIMTEGLLGSKYIALSPGFDTQFLKEGDQIDLTHSAIILENLIGKFLFKG